MNRMTGPWTRRARSFAVVAILAAGGTGCAQALAEMPPTLPPLDVPPVPPRVIAAAPETPALELAPRLEADLAEPVESPTPPPARPAPRPADAVPARAEPEPGPPEAPALELRLPQPGGDDAQVERQIRDRLGRADRLLRALNPVALSATARSQYESARRFKEQGDEALKARNYVFASYLADKAETMARELQARR